MQKNSDNGKVAKTSKSENAVRNMAQTFVGSPDVAVIVVMSWKEWLSKLQSFGINWKRLF